jgi:membrane protease YdiL (CAAX protease family)
VPKDLRYPRKKFIAILIWFVFFNLIWAGVRLFHPSEVVSELIAKPLVFLGSIFLFYKLRIIPDSIFSNIKKNYLTFSPFWKIFLVPAVFTIVYFYLTNFRIISVPQFTFMTFFYSIIVNFSTAIVEEITYRGVLYVWLKENFGEVFSFVGVQIFFLLGHVATLTLNSQNTAALLSHVFFIILLSIIHTIIFRFNKSLFSSITSHGIWNTFVYYFLLQ